MLDAQRLQARHFALQLVHGAPRFDCDVKEQLGFRIDSGIVESKRCMPGRPPRCRALGGDVSGSGRGLLVPALSS